MRKYLSVCRKELLLLIRDKAGLAMLFIMPAVLILISSMMQEFAWGSLAKDPSVQVLFVDNDHDSLGMQIKNGFKGSESFEVIDNLDHKPLTANSAKNAVRKGIISSRSWFPKVRPAPCGPTSALPLQKPLQALVLATPWY